MKHVAGFLPIRFTVGGEAPAPPPWRVQSQRILFSSLMYSDVASLGTGVFCAASAQLTLH